MRTFKYILVITLTHLEAAIPIKGTVDDGQVGQVVSREPNQVDRVIGLAHSFYAYSAVYYRRYSLPHSIGQHARYLHWQISDLVNGNPQASVWSVMWNNRLRLPK